MDLIERAVGVGVERAVGIGNDIALRFGEIRGVPSVQPRNVRAVSEYYKGHTPNERIVTIGQKVSSVALRPDVEISPLDSLEIQHHVESGGILLIVGPHIKGIDPLTDSAVVNDVPAFEVVRHSIIIPSKPAPFRIPGIRYLVDGMGSFPVTRKKDVLDKEGKVSKENKAFRAASAEFSLELMINHLENKHGKGGSVFLYPEGERNKGNPLEVQEFDFGAVYIYQKALEAGAKVALLTTGKVYDAGSIFRATVHIGGLFEPKGKNLKQKTASLRAEVQHSVNEARRIGYRNR